MKSLSYPGRAGGRQPRLRKHNLAQVRRQSGRARAGQCRGLDRRDATGAAHRAAAGTAAHDDRAHRRRGRFLRALAEDLCRGEQRE